MQRIKPQIGTQATTNLFTAQFIVDRAFMQGKSAIKIIESNIPILIAEVHDGHRKTRPRRKPFRGDHVLRGELSSPCSD